MARVPKGYRGVKHETIGSSIISLIDSVLMPEHVLGKELTTRLQTIRPETWYPVSTLLEPLELLDQRLGPDSIRKVGWSIFKRSHESTLRVAAASARDVVYGIDGRYHAANRGVDIGGWLVLEFAPGRAILQKTTPHHCMLEEGILEASLRAVKVPAVIYQRACFRTGSDACEFVIASHMVDPRWSGAPAATRILSK